jgi:uncharacterized protein YjiS (DUF1127 family)
MAYVQSETKIVATFFENLVTMARKTIDRYKQYRLYSHTVSELRSLSGRDLADLGLSRSMIESVAFSAVYEGHQDRTTFS